MQVGRGTEAAAVAIKNLEDIKPAGVRQFTIRVLAGNATL